MDLAQRTGLVREIACAQCLHAGVVLTVERRDCARAADCGCVLRRVNHRPRWYICTGLKAGFWAASGKGGLLNTWGAGATFGATAKVSMLKRPTNVPLA